MSDLRQQVGELSEKERELLDLMLEQEEGEGRIPIPRRAERETAPTTPVQRNIWCLNQAISSRPFIHPIALQITGSLEVQTFVESLRAVTRRHEALRTTCSVVDEKPVQVIQSPSEVSVPVSVEHLGEGEDGCPEEVVRSRVDELVKQPVDLEEGPLWQAWLLQVADEEFVFVLVMHTFIADGYAQGTLLQDLSAAYRALQEDRSLPAEPPVQFGDYAVWQHERLNQGRLDDERAYWLDTFEGELPTLQWPVERDRSTLPYEGQTHSLELSETLTQRLRDFTREQGATLFMVLMAAWKAVLYRLTRQPRNVVGTTVSNRDREALEPVLGYIANTVLIPNRLASDQSFQDVLEAVQSTTIDAFAHRAYPFEALLSDLSFDGEGVASAVQSMVVLHDHRVDQDLELPEMDVQQVFVDRESATVDLYLRIFDEGASEALSGVLEFRTGVIDPNTARRLIDLYQRILQVVVEDPDVRIGAEALLTETERAELIDQWEEALLPTDSSQERWQPAGAPQDEVEAQLVNIWAELLDRPDMGVHDNFFEWGGQSLLAVRLQSRIKRTFDLDFPLALLYRAPTVREFADYIRSQQEVPSEETSDPTVLDGEAGGNFDDLWSPLVPIQEEGHKLPFYCVHGAGGNVLNFHDLADHLDNDQPFWGLQARGVDGETDPHDCIEDMAAAYLKAIRKEDPNGPYLLGGYSGGGLIAFEMAHQLRDAGEEVRLLAFLDTFCPTLDVDQSRNLKDRIEYRLYGIHKRGLDSLRTWMRDRWNHESWRLRQWGVAICKRMGWKLPFSFREVYLTEAFLQAAETYELRPWPGKITLFTAQERDPNLEGVDPDLGWDEWAEGGVDVQLVPGNHDNLVLEPQVNALGAMLQDALDAAQR